MEIERLDLNLFRVFDMIMTHRSVAGASRELGVTASAVSHALTRLRKLLDDELFVASSNGMVPTQKSIELAPAIRDGIGNLTRALDARPFAPAQMVRTFGVAASDLTRTLVLPGVMSRLLSLAPNAGMRVFPLGRMDVVDFLDQGRLDLVVGWFGMLPDRCRRQFLMLEQEAMVVRAGHPLTRQEVTRERLLAFPHAVVEFTGSKDVIGDGFLDERGVVRRTWIERLLVEASGPGRQVVGRVALTLPDYGAIAAVVAATDMVATLPRRLAERSVGRDGLVMLELPYSPLNVEVEIVWHERADGNPGLCWLVAQFMAAAAGDAKAGIECESLPNFATRSDLQ